MVEMDCLSSCGLRKLPTKVVRYYTEAMADNRIYLCHRPTGISIGLGKRMGFRWWERGDFSDGMKTFFETVSKSLVSLALDEKNDEYISQLDDFVILKESERDKIWQALPPWPWQKGPVFKVQFLTLTGDKGTD